MRMGKRSLPFPNSFAAADDIEERQIYGVPRMGKDLDEVLRPNEVSAWNIP